MLATNDVFIVETVTAEDGHIAANIKVNPSSEILKGHFPGQPVVPGACMLQMVKDVLEDELNTTLLMKKASNVKFINMITPGSGDITLNINYKNADEDAIAVTAGITSNVGACFKLQAQYVKFT